MSEKRITVKFEDTAGQPHPETLLYALQAVVASIDDLDLGYENEKETMQQFGGLVMAARLFADELCSRLA